MAAMAAAASFTACKSSSSMISRATLTNNFSYPCFTRKDAKLPQLTLAKLSRHRLSVNCRRADADDDSSGKEPPESLFMKELKRRGMTPASSSEENDKIPYGLGAQEMKTREEGINTFTNRNDRGNFTGTEDWGQFNQRARSMALNSEGLEGLIPRAKVLLTLGGTFFIFFWPLILTTLAFFSAVYI
ncbi:hypothetical protein KI387_012734, partial [Taxus chinensis]